MQQHIIHKLLAFKEVDTLIASKTSRTKRGIILQIAYNTLKNVNTYSTYIYIYRYSKLQLSYFIKRVYDFEGLA